MDNHETPESQQPLFPEMQPIGTLPTMQTFNGIGTTVYGTRDFDQDTGSYVKTLWFVFLYLPIFALKAFRVVDAHPSGWYFLGRVPLSRMARAWNYFLILGIPTLAGVGLFWLQYNSADAVAERLLVRGDSLADEGELSQAAQAYQKVIATNKSLTPKALGKLEALTERPGRGEEVAAVFVAAVDQAKIHNAMPTLFQRGLQHAEKFAEAEPAAAIKILETIAPLRPADAARYVDLRRKLLERAVAAEPDNVTAVSAFAEMLELGREFDRCEKLLQPMTAKLGQSEGARILGQILVGQGKFEEAYPLLKAYADPRVQKLKQADAAFTAAIKSEDDAAFAELQKGKAAGFDFARYRSATKDVQGRMVQDYLDNRLKASPRVKEAQSRLHDEQNVVNVVLDLGIVTLKRGQAIADPQARRAELEKAEKTFLSVGGVAGQDEGYRLNLGQVYYWLGKEKEGRKLFDEAIKSSRNRLQTSIEVANLLREVGATSEARQMLEETYQKETDILKKNQVAAQRSLLFLDIDDRIAWLGKANSDDPHTKADLCSSLGRKAEENGGDEEAARQYRECIRIYESLPRSSSTLNNAAVAYSGLFRVTGDIESWLKSIDHLSKALELRPRDTIIQHNVTDGILARGITAIIDKNIDMQLLRRTGNLALLPFLYQNKAERRDWGTKLRKNADIEKAITLLDKLQVLAPKKPSAYVSLASIYSLFDDPQRMADVVRRMQEADLDLGDLNRHTLENYQGKDDVKFRDRFRANMPRLEQRVKSARAAGGITVAIAIDDVLKATQSLAAYGDPVDAAAMLGLAREAHEAAPSQATDRMVIDALIDVAHFQLARDDPAYKNLAAKHSRHMGPSFLMAVVLFGNGPSAKAALESKELKEALTAIKKNVELAPEEANAWQWAILHTTEPELTAKMADIAGKNEMAKLSRELSRKLGPLQMAEVCLTYWEHRMAGRSKEANDYLDAAAAQGMPLPLAEMKK